MVQVGLCLQTSNLLFVLILGISMLEISGSVEFPKWTYKNYPNPILEPYKCSRTNPSYVCDPDNVLGKGEANRLDFIVSRIRNDTLCICEECKLHGPGITVAIALMKSIANSSTTKEEQTKDFAIYLRHSWNFGQCDDDIIVLISSTDHQSHVALGPAVLSILPEELANRIYESSKGHFINGYYYQGLESIVESYYDVLRQLQHLSTEKEQPVKNNDITIALVVSVATLLALLLFLAVLLYRMKKKHQNSTLRTNLTRWHNPKQINVDDYESCKTDDHYEDGNNEWDTLEDAEDINQLNRISSIAKRQLSAVIEESENEEEEEEIRSERSRTLSFNQKSNANGIPRIPHFQ